MTLHPRYQNLWVLESVSPASKYGYLRYFSQGSLAANFDDLLTALTLSTLEVFETYGTWKCENHMFGKENHLNQSFIFGFKMLIFRGVSTSLKYFYCRLAVFCQLQHTKEGTFPKKEQKSLSNLHPERCPFQFRFKCLLRVPNPTIDTKTTGILTKFFSGHPIVLWANVYV